MPEVNKHHRYKSRLFGNVTYIPRKQIEKEERNPVELVVKNDETPVANNESQLNFPALTLNLNQLDTTVTNPEESSDTRSDEVNTDSVTA